MNNLDELHVEYSAVSAKMDEVQQEIKDEKARIASLNKAATAIKGTLAELTESFNKARKDRMHRAITAAQQVELQKQITIEMATHQAELQLIEDELANSGTDFLNLLNNELRGYSGQLHHLRRDIAADQLDNLADGAIDLAGEPLKKMALYLLSTQTQKDEPEDVYKIIGIEICKKLFGEQNRFKAKLPDSFTAKQQINEFTG